MFESAVTHLMGSKPASAGDGRRRSSRCAVLHCVLVEGRHLVRIRVWVWVQARAKVRVRIRFR